MGEGDVYVFSLQAHLKASIGYTWSSPVEGSDKRKFYPVLDVPPVQLAQDSIRASILSDFEV